MAVWLLLLIVFGAGLLGGTIDAIISDNGFVIPKKMDGILRPGWLGNALIGGIAAAISWSMYGPLAAVSIVTAADGGTRIERGLNAGRVRWGNPRGRRRRTLAYQ